MGSIAVVDIIIFVVLLAGVLTGLWKGAIRQVFSIGGLFAGLLLGRMLCHPLAIFLSSRTGMSDRVAVIVSFVVILVLVPILCTYVGELLSKLMKVVHLGFFDRLLGAVLGFVKFAVFAGLVIKLLDFANLTEKFADGGDECQPVLFEPVRNITDACLGWVWARMPAPADSADPDSTDGTELNDRA